MVIQTPHNTNKTYIVNFHQSSLTLLTGNNQTPHNQQIIISWTSTEWWTKVIYPPTSSLSPVKLAVRWMMLNFQNPGQWFLSYFCISRRLVFCLQIERRLHKNIAKQLQKDQFSISSVRPSMESMHEKPTKERRHSTCPHNQLP